jgi:hypothetical protein
MARMEKSVVTLKSSLYFAAECDVPIITLNDGDVSNG